MTQSGTTFVLSGKGIDKDIYQYCCERGRDVHITNELVAFFRNLDMSAAPLVPEDKERFMQTIGDIMQATVDAYQERVAQAMRNNEVE